MGGGRTGVPKERQAKLDWLDSDKYIYALRKAVHTDDLQEVAHLLAMGVDPNLAYGEDCMTGWLQDTPALCVAAFWNRVEVAKLLIEYGADVNAADEYDDTPLTWAVKDYTSSSDASFDMVELLLASGADADLGGGGGCTPLQLAASACNGGPLAFMLISHGADGDKADTGCGESAFMLATKRWSMSVAEAMLYSGCATLVDAANREGKTALIQAARLGRVNAVKLLLSNGASPNLTDKVGRTALFWAVHDHAHLPGETLPEGGLDMVTWSLMTEEAMGLPDDETPGALAPLFKHYMVETMKDTTSLVAAGCLLAIQELLRYGADVDLMDKVGQTPLFYAAANGGVEAVRLLLASGANRSLRDKEGRTPLVVAAQDGYLEVVQALLEGIAKTEHLVEGSASSSDLFMTQESTALALAQARGHAAVVQLLLDSGCKQQ